MILVKSTSISLSNRNISRSRPLLMVIAIVIATMTSGCSGANANAPVAPTGNAAPSIVLNSNPEVVRTLNSSCFTCHSENGVASGFGKIAPSYLFGVGDARKSLDFSAWQSYSASQKSDELAAITKVIKDGSMPPGDYAFLHPAARLSDAQRQILLEWTAREHPAPVTP